jgi:hypothetical protein
MAETMPADFVLSIKPQAPDGGIDGGIGHGALWVSVPHEDEFTLRLCKWVQVFQNFNGLSGQVDNQLSFFFARLGFADCETPRSSFKINLFNASCAVRQADRRAWARV